MFHTNLGSVVGRSKDQFRSTIVTRTNVRHVRLVLDQDLCASKVTKLQDPRVRIKQEILRLDVTMANSLRVNVRQGTEELVNIDFDLEKGHSRLELVEEAGSTIDCFWNILQYQIEVNFVFLFKVSGCHLVLILYSIRWVSYAFSIGIVECLEIYNVGMTNDAHDLQFAVLVAVSKVLYSCRECLSP